MIIAPVLQDVAARLASVTDDLRLREPARWAYAIRDAVAIVQPAWIVTHHDLDLEVAGLADQVGEVDDVPDADLAESPPGRAALELTATLVGLHPSATVAASVTGPSTVARRLAARLGEGAADLDDIAQDCGDAVAALAAAHAEHGAARVIVWEPEAAPAGGDGVARAHDPILRRLALVGVEAIAVGTDALSDSAYAAVAWAGGGRGAALLGRDAFTDGSSLEAAIGQAAAASKVAVSDGPVPGGFDLAALRRLAQSTPTTQHAPGATT